MAVSIQYRFLVAVPALGIALVCQDEVVMHTSEYQGYLNGLFYALRGVAHICSARPSFGVMWLTVSAVWFAGIVKSLYNPFNPCA